MTRNLPTSISRSAWPPERVALLTQLWDQGKSAGQIAMAMNDGLTRMAVLGKVHRLGLPGRRQGQQPKRDKVQRAPRAKKEKHGRSNKYGQSPFYKQGQSEAEAKVLIMAARERAQQFMEAKPVLAPNSNPTSLLDIEPHQCRFPLWAGDAPRGSAKLFCGAPVGEGAWCEFHRPVIYRDVNGMEVRDEKAAIKISNVELAA